MMFSFWPRSGQILTSNVYIERGHARVVDRKRLAANRGNTVAGSRGCLVVCTRFIGLFFSSNAFPGKNITDKRGRLHISLRSQM